MDRLALALALAALALPPAVRADPPRAEGRIDTDEGHVEILGRALRVGENLELPEGFIRVEEKGTEDEHVGSFTVLPAQTFAAAAAVAPADDAPSAGDPADRKDAAPPCRDERSAYLAELWKESGIEVQDPAAVLEGLDAGSGSEAGYWWFALATDPFRPLAWSSALRARADALARCVRGR